MEEIRDAERKHDDKINAARKYEFVYTRSLKIETIKQKEKRENLISRKQKLG